MGGPDIPYTQGPRRQTPERLLPHAAEKQWSSCNSSTLPTWSSATADRIVSCRKQAWPCEQLPRPGQARLLARSLAETTETAFLHCRVRAVADPPAHRRRASGMLAISGRADEIACRPEEANRVCRRRWGRVPPAAVPAQRAREKLIHVLMNHNDFVTVR